MLGRAPFWVAPAPDRSIGSTASATAVSLVHRRSVLRGSCHAPPRQPASAWLHGDRHRRLGAGRAVPPRPGPGDLAAHPGGARRAGTGPLATAPGPPPHRAEEPRKKKNGLPPCPGPVFIERLGLRIGRIIVVEDQKPVLTGLGGFAAAGRTDVHPFVDRSSCYLTRASISANLSGIDAMG